MEMPDGKQMIEGSVVLMPKNVLGYNDFTAAAFIDDIIDDIFELVRLGTVSLQLISSVHGDPNNGKKGKIGTAAVLENWVIDSVTGEAELKVHFEITEINIKEIGALIIKNNHHSQFFLKTVTLTQPSISFGRIISWPGTLHFVCNSWVYPVENYPHDRIFFPNKALLPSQTPELLRFYRTQELEDLQGKNASKTDEMRKEWERIYDYACYNDLGNPDDLDKGDELSRPILGGSAKYPYPRRVRTGRAPTKKDILSESRLPTMKVLNVYVPRDEMFGHLKMSDFLGNTLLSILNQFTTWVHDPSEEFDTFNDVLNIFEKADKFTEMIPNQVSDEPVLINKAGFLKLFPLPEVIRVDKSAWSTDEEFAREMLAGVNPVVIRSYKEASQRNLTCSLSTKEHIQKNLIGVTVDDAFKNDKIFVLDHHDTIMPYLMRINEIKGTKTYATRTYLYLKDDGTLKPIAIELSLPHSDGDKFGDTQVYTPAKNGVEGSIWQLAKAYVAVNDSGVHQLISHWLNTHAVIEPFIIATNRQLSVLHPIYKLLHPHFRDTMYINALARQVLINAGGIIESTFFPGEYAMEMSSAAYKNWVFRDQALPNDLINRGMAEENSKFPHGLRLKIKDYPYAADGLDIWFAIKEWVEEYCKFYYKNDKMVQEDSELQPWWWEVKNKGHEDKKDETWWPEMNSVKELTETCTIIIWIASALHAAVNFGQYPYAGYPLNRPTLSRKFMPEPGTSDYAELEKNKEKVFLEIITGKWESIRVLSVIETLSKHCSDEVYLGKPTDPDWTADEIPKKAFEDFGKKLKDIELKFENRNKEEKNKNRKMPYTLLYPSSYKADDPLFKNGLTGRGIPNSVSI